jgi:AraC-like DNA-binding protein
MPIDIALRTAGVCLLLVTAAVLALSAPRAPLARWFAPFALGVSGFLGVNTAFDAAELPEPWWSMASFCSRMAALFLWLFCLALFDGRLRAPRLAWAVGLAWFTLVVLDKEYLVRLPSGMEIAPLQIALGTGLLLHAGWRAMRDLRDDLIEGRRRARPVFALALLGLLAMDIGVDVMQGYDWRPASFLLLQNATIVALTAALALWLLRAEPWVAAETAAVRIDAKKPESDSDAATLARLEAVMRDDRPWLDPELTVAQFAARVGLPEPVLRRVINHRLGHGHFRNYLNGYRIEEAKRRLRDPAASRDKILTIALESGFSSLASFNRVFRQAVQQTPSEFRDG